MEQHHFNPHGPNSPHPLTITTSKGSTLIRVEMSMDNTNRQNESTIYTSTTNGYMCAIDDLIDTDHYEFICRCGCGDRFAGYGSDIKAANVVGVESDSIQVEGSNVNLEENLPPYQATTVSVGTAWIADREDFEESFTVGNGQCMEMTVASIQPTEEEMKADLELVEGSPIAARRYVSDRYVMKAIWGLTDEEIDRVSRETDHKDLLETMGVDLSRRQPPAIASKVYSMSTGEGPFTLVDYKDTYMSVGRESHKVLCGVCRNDRGKLQAIPLADLTTDWTESPVKVSTFDRVFEGAALGVLLLTSGICGS